MQRLISFTFKYVMTVEINGYYCKFASFAYYKRYLKSLVGIYVYIIFSCLNRKSLKWYLLCSGQNQMLQVSSREECKEKMYVYDL